MIDTLQLKELEHGLVSEGLFYSILESPDKETLFLKIDYLEGKFTIERVFSNNLSGREEMNKTKKELLNEKGLRTYLGLGELNV